MAAIHRSEGFPAWDIWFLHTVSQGSYQMQGVVGTSPSSSSVGFTGELSPPGHPTGPTLLSSKGAGHTRMVGPSVFSDSQVIPECLVCQYFQIHGSYQNGWSFSISRFTSHTRTPGPSALPDSRVTPECLVLQYPKVLVQTPRVQRHKFRHPKCEF